MNKSYQVFVFLGPFADDKPDQWPTEPNLVGINGIFSNSSSGNGTCSNCENQAAAKLTVMDAVPLTKHLIKWIKTKHECPEGEANSIKIEDLGYEHVKAFLARNLHWRVADMNLYPFREECTFVKVQAVERTVHLPKTYDEKVCFGQSKVEGKTNYPSAPQTTKPSTEYNEKPVESAGCCGAKCVIQ
jgi:hypothetical protein